MILVYSLFKNQIKHKDIANLSLDRWGEIINTAVDFATHVCESYDNYLAESFASQYKLE